MLHCTSIQVTSLCPIEVLLRRPKPSSSLPCPLGLTGVVTAQQRHPRPLPAPQPVWSSSKSRKASQHRQFSRQHSHSNLLSGHVAHRCCSVGCQTPHPETFPRHLRTSLGLLSGWLQNSQSQLQQALPALLSRSPLVGTAHSPASSIPQLRSGVQQGGSQATRTPATS
jgi:hypothetical protein